MLTNHFQHRIEKEEINTLPLAEFHGEVIVVRNQETLDEALGYLGKQHCVGVDTETRPSFEKGQHFPTALLQIATTKRCYLFQLRYTGFTPAMADFFANPAVCKVGLAFHDDITGLQRLHPFTPTNCIDLQKIVLKYGILDLGLQKMFAIIFHQKISKSQQLTNWENPVLTPEQARYAATDAWATLLIYKQLRRTRQLPRAAYLHLRQDDLLLQQQHQLLIQQQRQTDISHDPHLSQET